MSHEDAHLHGGRAGKRVHQGKALEKPLLAQPPTPLLHFGLDQTPDRRCAVPQRADPEEHADDFPSAADIVCWGCSVHTATPSREGWSSAWTDRLAGPGVCV